MTAYEYALPLHSCELSWLEGIQKEGLSWRKQSTFLEATYNSYCDMYLLEVQIMTDF
jgi:hypothetical protein